MNELELVKQTTVDYTDLDVFDEGEIYYIIDATENKSCIAVCLSVEQDKAVFKSMNYLTGDWIITKNNCDRFIIDGNNPKLAAYLHIFPVRLNFQINMRDMKLTFSSEIQLHMT